MMSQSEVKNNEQNFLQEGATEAAAMLRTLGNERRLVVLCLLIEHGEMTVSALGESVGLSQSALSQHLAKMREEGLVEARREAQSAYYYIADARVRTLVAALKDIFCP